MFSVTPWITAIIFAAAIVFGIAVVRYLVSTQRSKDYPPGPPTLLGVGNLHQIPLKQPFIKFHEWSKTYGDIIGLKAGPSNIVVLHNTKYVRELLDKRAAIYSGRPYSYIPAEHVFCQHGDKHILNLQNGPYLRQWRAAVAYLVGPAGLKQTVPMQEATAANLAYKLLDTNPSKTLEHLKHWALATPLLAISGQRLEDRGSAFADRFFLAQKHWLQLLEPGNAPPVDLFPLLRLVPESFADWKGKARYVREYMFEEYFRYLNTAKGLLGKGRPSKGSSSEFRSLMTKILEDREQAKKGKEGERQFTDDDVAYLGGGLLDAAVDTTWASIMAFVMFMAAYPRIQAKVQEEVDRLSPDKPPTGDMVDNLVYTRACLMEIFRFRPPAPNGLPHVLDRDDTFQGYKIPKGTTILANVWGIQRNPDEYDRPEEFVPERFIEHPLGLKPGLAVAEGRRATYTFGSGRRICPGEQFAQKSIILAMGKLMWAFDIKASKPLDTSVETGFHTGLVLGPEPFDVDFGLRESSRKAQVIDDYTSSNAHLDRIIG